MFTLGFTFRNSKWSSYNRSNTNSFFVRNYKSVARWFFILIVVFYLVYTMHAHGMSGGFTGRLYVLFWFFGDAVNYVRLALVTLWLVALQASQEAYYTFLLRSILVKPTTGGSQTTSSKALTSKGADATTFYAWLVSSYGSGDSSIEAVYDRRLGSAEDKRGGILFKHLFLSSRAFGVGSLSTTPKASIASQQFQSLDAVEVVSADNFLMSPGTFRLFSGENSGPSTAKPSTWTLRSRLDWSLSSSHRSNTNASLEATPLRAPTGSFNLPIRDLSTMGRSTLFKNELAGLQSSIDDRILSAKWSRWLYKYNILHRKSLLSSHANTLTKRLLGSGFYDSSLFLRNTHSGSISALHSNPNEFFRKGFIESYGNYIPTSGTLSRSSLSGGSKLQSNYAMQISHYEDSYAWMLKRYYLFSTLPSTARVSYPELKSPAQVGLVSTPTDSSFTKFNLVKSLGQPYFNSLEALIPSDGAHSTKTKAGDPMKPILLSTGVGELFDYDFTEVALGLLNNPATGGSSYFWHSNLTNSPYTEPLFNSQFKGP